MEIISNLSSYSVGTKVEGKVCILNTEHLTASNNTPYLVYLIYDKVKHIFRSSPKFLNNGFFSESMLLKNCIADIKGVIGEFKEYKNFEITNLTDVVTLPESEIILDIAGVSKIWEEFTTKIKSFKNQVYKTLAEDICNTYKELLVKTPAATAWHDSTFGGLLMHSNKVYDLSKSIFENLIDDKENFNTDVIEFCALFHDIGKIFSYDTSAGKITYTMNGRMLYHINDGISIIEPFLFKHNIHDQEKLLIKHIILSHHGSKEMGSNVNPLTIEALVIHYADLIEANINGFYNVVKTLKKGGNKWIDFKDQFIYNF